MAPKTISRREFVVTGFVGTLAIASGFTFKDIAPIVSVVKIKNNNPGFAVEKARNSTLYLYQQFLGCKGNLNKGNSYEIL